MGKKGKFIPGFLLRGLERVIRQDDLNEMLRVADPAEGSEFSKRILDHLEISVATTGLDALPEEPFIFASNHPLGGLDGIALVCVLGARYGDDNVRVMVNDLLMNVTPLSGVFLPVNKYGARGGRESSRLLNDALASGKQIVMFPAGLVSRLHPAGSGDRLPRIRDLQWKKSFVSKALESGRRIVPVYFEGANSIRFYKIASWRKRLGIKVNLEQALLPSELCKSRGKAFHIHFGRPVDPAVLRGEGKSMAAIVDTLYDIAYSLRND